MAFSFRKLTFLSSKTMPDSNPIYSNPIFRLFCLILNIIKVYIESILNLFKKQEKKSIKGQNVLITGSGHGLGRELAIKFAYEGVNLVLVDINETNNEEVKNEVLKHYKRVANGGALKVLTYCVDIRDEKKVFELANKVESDLGGGIDILVNNAGIVQCLPFLELAPELVERTFQINALAHIWTIRNFLPGMIKRRKGHIVAIASIAGIIGNKYLADYCASKFAIVGLMESLDMEIHDGAANENIHFTTICPASMSTGMFKTLTTRFNWLLPVMKANQVASEIIDAILLNKSLVVIPEIALIMHRISLYVPRKVRLLVREYFDYGVKPHKI